MAHGGLVNTDVGLACFVFLTVFGFYRLADKITLSRVVFTALGFGLAMSTKFTALWLIPILIILGLIRALSQQGMVLRIPKRGEHPVTSRRAKLGAIAVVWVVVGLVGYLTLWGAYQFRYWTVAPAGDPALTAYFDGISPNKPPLKQAFSFMREYQLLPESYLFGVARVLEKKSRKAFLLGETGGGWWYYFFVTFVLKTPLPLMFLLGLGLVGLGWGQEIRAGPIFLCIPVLVYFGIAVLSHLNIGHRHILVIYPFLFVLASSVVPWVQRKGRAWKGLVAGLSVWYVISSLSIFPHYLAYFNELAGGPDKGHEYLVDSNLDWGQDLKGLKKFMDRNGIDRVWLSYFGTANPDYYGIDYNYLPGNLVDFNTDATRLSVPSRFLAISATNLQGVYKALNWGFLRDREPVAKIGYSIFVYEFDHPIHIEVHRETPARQ